jgi:copper chaperone
MDTLQLPIEGMSCGGCVASVRRALETVTNAVIVSVEVGQAVVRAAPETREKLVAAIEDAGFDVPV